MSKVFVLLVEKYLEDIAVEQLVPEVFTTIEDAIQTAHDDHPDLVKSSKYVIDYYAECTNEIGLKTTAFIYECEVK